MRKRLLCVYREALPLFVLIGRKGGKVWMLVGDCHNRPSEALTLASLSPSCASASPSLAVVHNTPSPMAGLRLASPSPMAAGWRWWGYFVDFFVGRRGAFFVVARRAEALDALASSATMARQSCRLSAFASLSLGIL